MTTLTPLKTSGGSPLIVSAGSAADLTVTLKDFDDATIDAALVDSLTLTLYDLETGAIINSVDGTDVQDANHGTIAASILTLRLQAADNPIITTTLAPGGLETHVAEIDFTWNDGVSARASKNAFSFTVRHDAGAGGVLRWRRGEDNSRRFVTRKNITGWAKVHFSAKGNKVDADTAAIVHLELVQATGVTTLQYLAGAAPAVGEAGTIAVNDAAGGIVTVTLNAAASAKLTQLRRGYYDIQMIDGSGVVTTMTEGLFLPNMDVVRDTD